MSKRPPRQPDQEPTATLTHETYERLTAELENLKTEGRRNIAERLGRAREHGDIRENAEYDAAKDAQGLMEARIRELERMLRDPDVVEGPQTTDAVIAGVLVTVRPVDDEEDEEDEVFLIAASKEERAAGARTVSVSSPLGKALVGKKVGERVTYEAPGGVFTYEVVSIQPPAASAS